MIRLFDEWQLLPQRIALHRPSATAVLADIHLGYSAARQRQGDAIPTRTVVEELQSLADAAGSHDICAVVVAGDLFEKGFDPLLYEQFIAVLSELDIKILGLIPGNHDRGIELVANEMPLCVNGYDLAGWHIHHGDQPIDHPRLICGHWHPAVRWKRRKVPCFLTKAEQMILPAFSLDAAGVDVDRDPRWRDWERYAIWGEGVIRVIDE
jgi:putative SbcD/Mre11-related phosphoesterase